METNTCYLFKLVLTRTSLCFFQKKEMNFQWKKQNEKSLTMHIKDFIYIYVPYSENNNIR